MVPYVTLSRNGRVRGFRQPGQSPSLGARRGETESNTSAPPPGFRWELGGGALPLGVRGAYAGGSVR